MLEHQLTFAHAQENMVKEAAKFSQPPVKNYLMEHLIKLSAYITTLEEFQRDLKNANVPRHIMPQMNLPNIPQLPELPVMPMPEMPESQVL